jgi:tetratricopeptide (TPR) repeat protein
MTMQLIESKDNEDGEKQQQVTANVVLSNTTTADSAKRHHPHRPPLPSPPPPSVEEKATEWKDKGNLYFGQKDLQRALDAYQAGITILTSSSSISMCDSVTTLEVALRSNLAQVLLKMNNYDRALEECNFALDLQPQSPKGKSKCRGNFLNMPCAHRRRVNSSS